MTEYLATLAPLLRPKMVLGDHVEDGTEESTRRSDKAFKDLQTLYETVAGTKPFNLPRELTLPLRLIGSGLEITPVDTRATDPVGLRHADDHGALAADVDPDLFRAIPLHGCRICSRPSCGPATSLVQLVVSYLLMHVGDHRTRPA